MSRSSHDFWQRSRRGGPIALGALLCSVTTFIWWSHHSDRQAEIEAHLAERTQALVHGIGLAIQAKEGALERLARRGTLRVPAELEEWHDDARMYTEIGVAFTCMIHTSARGDLLWYDQAAPAVPVEVDELIAATRRFRPDGPDSVSPPTSSRIAMAGGRAWLLSVAPLASAADQIAGFIIGAIPLHLLLDRTVADLGLHDHRINVSGPGLAYAADPAPDTVMAASGTLALGDNSYAIELGMPARVYGELAADGSTGWVILGFVCSLLLPLVLHLGLVAQRRSRGLERLNAELEDRVDARTAELQQQLREVERLNEEVEQFAYMASHDLQEPLRKIISFSGLLRKDLGEALPEQAAEDLVYICDGARRMQTLISDLLALSRVRPDQFEATTVDLGTCLDAAIGALAETIAERGARIDRQAIGQAPPVLGDPVLITQLFQNLIGNAIKFNDADPPRVTISTAPDSASGAVVVHVSDNGIGIKPAYVEQIFHPFRRLHGRQHYGGTGIGLAVCAKAVKLLRGRIWAVSAGEGQGTTFSFTLPTRSTSLDDDPLRRQA